MNISIAPEEVFKIGGFVVTNTFLVSLIVSGVVFLLFTLLLRKGKVIPSPRQNFGELILETIYKFIDSITQDRSKTEGVFPLAATLFLLILFSNLLELVPGLGVFPILRSPSSDLNFTLALSATSMVLVHIAALRRLGKGHINKYINFRNPILGFVGMLEGVGEITRIFSLAIRLFGNLFAGEVLLTVVSYLFAYIAPLPFLALEILVAVIQATIFSTLIVIFYTTATEGHHE